VLSHAVPRENQQVQSIAIIEAPSILGLRPTGVEQLPDALDRAGLAEKLNSEKAGRVVSATYSGTRDPETGFLNPRGIRDYSYRLAARFERVLDKGRFPLVIGGDCSILLGSMLALKRRGRHGLLFLDGHMDFYQADANINGEAASSDLALVTGRGPSLLTTYDGLCPLVADEDVVAFGFRDEIEAQSYGSQPLPRALKSFSLSEVRRLSAETAAWAAVDHVSARGDRAFWIHFDADVLSDEIMPAVDYRLPDGLNWAEIETVLGAALGSSRAVGMEITIFNPTLDPDGEIARAFVEMLARVFRQRVLNGV
jgi:arginase